MDQKNELNSYVNENKDKLERLALHGNTVVSAMALTLLKKAETQVD